MPAAPSAANRDPVAGAAVRDAARAHEPDRYLAALLAPRRSRGDLIALAAFVGEIRRIRDTVGEPLLAEIRLQWWREAIAGAPDARTGSPVADAMQRVITTDIGGSPPPSLPRKGGGMASSKRQGSSSLSGDNSTSGWLNSVPPPPRGRLGGGQPQTSEGGSPPLPNPSPQGGGESRRLGGTQNLVLDMIDAHARALHPPPLDLAALEDFAAQTDGAAFRLAARILAGEPTAAAVALSHAAGRAYGLARVLGSGLPVSADSASTVATARRHLGDARHLLDGAPREARTAFLPLALVEPYLRAFEKGRNGPNRATAGIAPLTRVWRLWRAKRLGRV